MGFMLPAFFSKIGNFIVTHWAKIKTAAYLATLAVGVKGFMQAKEMMGRGQDIMANKTAAGGKIPVIYGTRRVGCQVVYMDVSNNDSRDLYVVYALSVGECDEILGRTIELDGSRLTDGSRFRDGGYIGTDKISSGNGSLNTVSQNGTGIDVGAGQFGTSPTAKYRYVFNLHHGAATQVADPMLVASMPNWTSAHKLNGVAYIACHFGYDKEGMWQGVPQMTVQVRGKKVFDPRDSSQTFGTVSTYKYSDNPALCFLDLISNNDYGKGLTAAQLNMSTFTSAANVCDTEVDQPYFNGSSQPLTWSGNAGDNFITIGGTNATTTWWQNKVGELIDIYDTNGNGVIDGAEIIAINRDNFYDENEELIVYINDTLGSNYSSQTGSSLVKVKRFHCNGYLRTDKNVMENARELLANMRGIFLYINGQYELSIEDTGSSTFSINDSHIISDSGITVDYGNKDKKANKVIVEYFNANKKYELDTATVLHDANPQYYSDDGDEILEVKAEFPFITDPYIAYNMAKTILTRSRNQTTMQFVGTPEMYKLNIADIVTLTYAGLGFNGKVCRVEALELMPDGLVQVSLIEYFDVYTWEVPPQEPVEELANLPSAYAVKPPTGLAFTDTDSSSTGRPFLSWNTPTDFPDYQYRVNVVDGSGNQVKNTIVDVTNTDLMFLPVDANYVASVTSLNTLGTESNPATLTFTIGDAPAGTPDIKNEAITEQKLGDGSVTNIKVLNLSAGKINTGELNLGQASGMAVRQTKTGYTSTATGFWLGNDGGTPKFNIGTSTNYLKFDGTDLDISGEISATTGEIGGFTIGTNSITNPTADSKIQIGSGSDVFTVDGDGIYLGNSAFASAPFKALNTGEVQTTKSFTAGVAGSGQIAKMAGTGDYRFWSGSETPSNASFSVDKSGKVIAKNLVLKLTDGTVYFDSQTGFSDSALSQISLTTGTKVTTISNTFDADTEYEQITVTEDTDVNVSVSIDTNFGGSGDSVNYNYAVDGSENQIPDEFTLTIQHSSDGGSNYADVLTDTFTRVNDRENSKPTPAADEYKINTDTDILYIGDQGGVRILASTTTSLNLGCVDADGRTTLTTTGLTLTGISTGTTHRIKATVSSTDNINGIPDYDAVDNNVTSTAPRVISVTDPSGDGFYVGDNSGSTVAPAGDITRVQITTASNSGLTGGANFASGDALFSLALGSTFAGNKTFSNNVVIQGNLDVQGTTTTISTANLDVKDKNITLNYGSGDTSANANGAGFTIQDAVSVGNDASLTWTTANDTFNLSHPLSITGALTLNNTAISGVNQLAFNDPGVNEGIEWTGGNTKIFESPDNLTNAAGNLQVTYGGTRRLTVNSSGIDVNGVINSGSITSSGVIDINASGASDRYLQIGSNTTTNHFSYIDLIGDATYTDYGLRVIRNNNGANTTSQIIHRGTGNFDIQATDSASIRIRTASQDALTINSSQNATFAGTISATGGNSTNWNTAYAYSQTDGTVLRKRTNIPSGANLNTYTSTGFYHQSSNASATAGSNYPLNTAGMLTVTAESVFIYQTYQAYDTHATYERKYYNGTWRGWHQVYDSGVFANNSANWNTAYTVANAALPRTGGSMTGTITGRDLKLQVGYHLQRSDHHSGHLEGSYNNVGANGAKSNPIYTIGSNYNPASTTLSNMYGIGFCHSGDASFVSLTGGSNGWGQYVASDGDARIFLNAQHGTIQSTGEHYVNGSRVFHDTYHPNADTLTTARTINGVSFNGSANITVADSTKLPLAGGTMTGTLAMGANAITSTGTITSGRVTTSQDFRFSGSTSYIRGNGNIHFLTIAGSAQNGRFKSVAAQTNYINGASVGMFNALNGYAVGTGVGITVIDASRNITAGTISSGNITLANNSKINLWTTAGSSGNGTIHMPRAGAITFYGDESLAHSITSRNSAGVVGDDLRINSYGAVSINLDSNNNNSSAADFLIGRHGGQTGTISDFFRINGETGVITQTISNVGIPTLYSSFTMEATDAQLDLVSSSAGTWGSAINFVEGASTTANTNNWSIARKTSGGGNTLNFNFGTANQHDNTTRMTFASDGAITATGFITGTRLRVGDGNDGYFYSDTNGRTAFANGEFYIQTSVPNFYNYATNTYMGATSGDTIHFRGNVITANNWGIPASGTITSTGIRTSTNQGRVKLGVWSDNTYGIGMQTGYTYGGLNNDYAMSFQMNSDNDRGFWWGDSSHTNAQGAMSLTTQGRLTVAEGIRVGYGETDTVIPSAGLAVNGAITSTGNVTLGTFSTTNTGTLILTGSTANKKAELKCTNGNLHIDSESGNAIYLNYYEGSGIFFGNGGSSYRALMNTSGHLNLASTGAAPTGYALSVGTVGVIDTARNIVSANNTLSGSIKRTNHNVGFLEGSYNNVGANSYKSNPIYTIGSAYNPGTASLGSMYGIGYSHSNFWGSNKSSGWGLYVTNGGTIHATISHGGMWSNGAILTNSNVTASGNVTAYSDERLKENIQTLDSKKALQMRGVSFIKDGIEGSGVIAQEIEEIAPELVMTADDEMGTKSVAYGNLVGYLIETVKDQQKQIDELKQRLDNGSS